MSEFKAIETRYRGYRFRSRLEARWAVFFDALGIRWEYEKQGYDLEGTPYLPDFWLPAQRQWVEIKGERNKEGWREAYLLAKHTGLFVCILHGDFCPIRNDPSHGLTGHGYGWYGDNRGTWPNDPDPVAWGKCPKCDMLSVAMYGFQPCPCLNLPGDSAEVERQCANQDAHPLILRAYTDARSARFEHGESPK